MKDLLLLEKKPGETPLACINRFRVAHPEYVSVKMTYAGRLDPIASGLLVVLAGDAVHEKNSYLGLSKTYKCSCVLGIATDTYDVLGIPTHSLDNDLTISESAISDQLMSYVGTFQQLYPSFSSKTIDGVQMHTHARAGTLQDEKIPKQLVTVSSIELITILRKNFPSVVSEIDEIISTVVGDFRQQDIKSGWNDLAKQFSDKQVIIVSFTITVSGGTYIRGIVDDLGKKLGTGACIIKLHRTKVGDFELENREY
jgi:tRNA pseudouridine55 synthase